MENVVVYWCNTHKRTCGEAGCDASLGGITMPCEVVKAAANDDPNNPKTEVAQDGIDHFNMTRETWLELFSALIDEADKGNVRAVAIMLGPENSDMQMIEHFGKADVLEITCRKVNEKLAIWAHRAGHKNLAAAIRAGMRGGAGVN